MNRRGFIQSAIAAAAVCVRVTRQEPPEIVEEDEQDEWYDEIEFEIDEDPMWEMKANLCFKPWTSNAQRDGAKV